MSVSPPETAQSSSKRYYYTGLSHLSFRCLVIIDDNSACLFLIEAAVNNMLQGVWS